MSLQIASLNSGSNGNCYYISNGSDAVLIDAGLSCKETEKRMNLLGLSLQKVKAIFISHEHSDHIKGLEVISRKHQIPVYISKATLHSSRLRLDPSLVRLMGMNSMTTVNGLDVFSFPKLHDAAEPCSFTVTGNGVKVGIFTDLGDVCDNLILHFKDCHAAFLEANYDGTMLEQGPYPYHLKKRISGGKGHLSNIQALQLFIRYRTPHLSHLLLSHLSRENNTPQLAADLFRKEANNTEIIVASRDVQTELYTIGTGLVAPLRKKLKTTSEQLALF